MHMIVTERLLLKPFSLKDSTKIYQMSIEEGMKSWIPDQVYEDENEAKEVLTFLKQQYGKSPKESPVVLAVYLRSNQALIGHVGLSPLGNDVEVGYAIEDKEQGKGYATEAVVAMTDWGLREFNLDFIIGSVAADNVGSCKVLQKAGFQYIENIQKKLHGKEIVWGIYKKFLKS